MEPWSKLDDAFISTAGMDSVCQKNKVCLQLWIDPQRGSGEPGMPKGAVGDQIPSGGETLPLHHPTNAPTFIQIRSVIGI